MMVGRNVNFHVEKEDKEPGKVILKVENMTGGFSTCIRITP